MREPVAPSQPGFLRRLAIAGVNLSAILLTGLLLLYFSLYLLGSQWWFIDSIGAVLPWLFAPLVVLLPLALWLHKRLPVILLAISAALFLVTYGHLFTPALPAQTTGPTFTVMTYNVLFRAHQADPVLAEIERHDADIIALQELQPPKYQTIRDQLSARYPYYNAWENQGLFSRFPIEACEKLRDEGMISGWVHRCVLLVHDRPVTVYNLHARPPLIAKGKPFGLPLEIVQGLDKSKNESDLQAALTDMEKTAGPLIVVGDFNLSDRHAFYRLFQRDLQDAFRARGWGLGFTYTRFRGLDLPIWRIDYIFYSPELIATGAWLGDFSTSDHRPVVARLGFASER